MDWTKIIIGVAAVAAAGAAAIAYGGYRWDKGTRALRAQLDAARLPAQARTYDPRETDSLPAPVQRYFHAVLKPGQPMVTRVEMAHEGTFNMSEDGERWARFTSTQLVVTARPGFDWDGRIALLPFANVHVHDAYASGEGILQASLFGLITLADMRGTPELAQGELMRYLAEAAWYPTALLPSQGVRWEGVDDRSARATLADGGTSVSLVFGFDERGLIDTVRAQARPRTVGADTVPTPWQGRFWNYETRNGMLVPQQGEVAWLLPGGAKPYWRGTTVCVAHGFGAPAELPR